jgi:GT2 family glycosyltransferase
MDRPELLQRCLESIQAGTRMPAEVVISDYSRDAEATRAVCAAFPGAAYARGPRRGLGANSNAGIRRATGSHVAMLDDDAMVSADFVERALEAAGRLGPKAVITGECIEHGVPLRLHNPSFWGHFTKDPGGRYEAVHTNCVVIPRSAFTIAKFDERVSFGYDESELFFRLLPHGYRIHYEPALVTQHLPPGSGTVVSVQRERQIEQARFYITLKRYALWERSPAKVAAFLLLAPLHRAAHATKFRNWRDLPRCATDMVWATRAVMREAATAAEHRPAVSRIHARRYRPQIRPKLGRRHCRLQSRKACPDE